MKVETQKLKPFLLDAGVLNESQLEKFEKQSLKNNRSLSDELIASKVIEEAEFKKLEAYIIGIPFVNLKKEKIKRDVLSIIPEQIARTHNIVAFGKDGKNLMVAMLDPDDLQAIDFIKKKSQMEILPCLASKDGIEYALEQYKKNLQAEVGEIIKESANITNKEDLQKMAEDLPVIKILDTLLKHAIMEGASDVHIEPDEEDVVIRYRVDGILSDAMSLPRQVLAGIIARVKVLSNLKLDEHRLPQDGRFKVNFLDKKISVRVSVIPVFDGEKAVLRILSESSKGLTLERLGMSGNSLEIVHRNIKKPSGMILSTGPTGSGKTTSLYTILDILNTPQVNISTIEDPIEYQMPRINQTQTNSKIGLDFASGLRSILRQDPDIMMVGEIRDNETAEIAIHASMTGHLVFSTLHTNSAVGSLPRLIDMGIEPFLIASSVNVVIAQRLVRRVCSQCSTSSRFNKDALRLLSKNANSEKINAILRKEGFLRSGKSWEEAEIRKAGECDKCKDGYQGRAGIFEIMEISDSIRDLIEKKESEDRILSQARKEGMITMLEDGIIKIVKGITTMEEVLRVVEN